MLLVSLVAVEVDVVISMDNDDIRNGTEWNPTIIVCLLYVNGFIYFNLIYLAFVSI